MASKNWIAGAIKHPGAFSAKAKKAGVSTSAFAKKQKGKSTVTGDQARLALTLMKMHPKKKAAAKPAVAMKASAYMPGAGDDESEDEDY